MQCVPRTLRAIASSIWMALSVALIPSSGSFAESPQSKFADVNGAKLHYLVAGKGDPVVLLHGFAQTSRSVPDRARQDEGRAGEGPGTLADGGGA